METLGRRFMCLRDIILGTDIYYLKGRIYKSEEEGCITNEYGGKGHCWIEDDHDIYWKSCFTLMGNKRRSGRWRISE